MKKLLVVITLLLLVFGLVQSALAQAPVQFLSNQVAVKWASGFLVQDARTQQATITALDQLQGSLKQDVAAQQLEQIGWAVIDLPNQNVDEAVVLLAALPTVAEVEKIGIAHIDSQPDEQWGLYYLGVPQALRETVIISRAVVAVVDTGVDYTHPALGGCMGPESSICKVLSTGTDFVNKDGDPMDDNGHGTHVAGTVAGDGVGVCPDCRVMPIKVLDEDGEGDWSHVASGFIWAVEEGAQVINASLGGEGSGGVMRDAVAYAKQRGVLMVTSCGNAGKSPCKEPAKFSGVVAVIATDETESKSSWSNWGKSEDNMLISAPGVNIRSSVPGGGYESWSGTSMAAPHVAGVAGLVYSANPSLSNIQVWDAIKNSALDLGDPGFDQIFGHGRVCAVCALGLNAEPLIYSVFPDAVIDWRAQPVSLRLNAVDQQGEVLTVAMTVDGFPLTVVTQDGNYTGTYVVPVNETRQPVLRPTQISVSDGGANDILFEGHVVQGGLPYFVYLPSVVKK